MLSSRCFGAPLLKATVFAFFCALLPAKGAWAQIANTIQMTVSWDSLRADGYSRAVITAEVRDRSGALVPDGTQVRFYVTLGTTDPVATTESGRARVNLTRPALTGPGVGVVTATSGQGGAAPYHRQVFLNYIFPYN